MVETKLLPGGTAGDAGGGHVSKKKEISFSWATEGTRQSGEEGR